MKNNSTKRPSATKAMASAAILACVTTTAGCKRTPAPPPPLGDYQVLAASTYSDSCTFCAVPDVQACGAGADPVRLHWHVRDGGAKEIVLSAAKPDGDEESIGRYGPEGTTELGAGVPPGQVFRIRDQADGRLLGELTVAGVGC